MRDDENGEPAQVRPEPASRPDSTSVPAEADGEPSTEIVEAPTARRPLWEGFRYPRPLR